MSCDFVWLVKWACATIEEFCNFVFQSLHVRVSNQLPTTLPETNSSHLKICRAPKGNEKVFQPPIFRAFAASFRGYVTSFQNGKRQEATQAAGWYNLPDVHRIIHEGRVGPSETKGRTRFILNIYIYMPYCWQKKTQHPVDMISRCIYTNIPWFTRFHASQPEKDFFHQQYGPYTRRQLSELPILMATNHGHRPGNGKGGTLKVFFIYSQKRWCWWWWWWWWSLIWCWLTMTFILMICDMWVIHLRNQPYWIK